MKFVVTGCARSGTKYSAHLLLGAGLQCGHEDVFNSWGTTNEEPPDWKASDFDGDSSYNAAPFLGGLNDDIVVVHLLRPPLDQIRSAVGTGEVDTYRPWVSFIDHHTGILDVPAGPQRAAAYWLRWNAMIAEYADLTWRLPAIGLGQIDELCNLAGLPFDPDRAQQAIDSTPRTTNHRTRDESVQLADLGTFASGIEIAAKQYGLPLETAAV